MLKCVETDMMTHSYPLKSVWVSVISLLAVLLPSGICAAEESDAAACGSGKIRSHQVSAEFVPSYIFQTNMFVRGENASSRPMMTYMSAHLKYGFSFGENTFYGRFYPHAVQGIGISYNAFFNPGEVGNPAGLYFFQNSRIAELTETLSLRYEWNFGASFGWKPHDFISNPFSVVAANPVNAYIYAGILLDWEFSPGWSLSAGAGFSHFSNGNTAYPNAGINAMGGRIGVTGHFGSGCGQKSFGCVDEGTDVSDIRAYGDAGKVTYDLVLYGAVRKRKLVIDSEPYYVPGVFGVAGINFNPLYNVNRFFRAGISLDMQWDESANIGSHVAGVNSQAEYRFHRPSFMEQFSMGLSARVELVMPVFTVNVGIGRNFICRGKDTDGFYQIFALKADITRYLFIHAGYQIYDFREANNLMLGIGFRFNASRRR